MHFIALLGRQSKLNLTQHRKTKMYQRDATEIATLAKHNNSVAPIIGFTLSTIQAGLQTCTGQAQKVIDNGYSANCLWGLKSDGLKYAIDNDAWLYQKAMHIVD
mgnify:CR=1 FL=1